MPKEQLELSNMPPKSPLAKMAQKFMQKKESINELNLEIENLEKEMLAEMKKEKAKRFRMADGPDSFEISMVESAEHVRCKKITKQRRDHVKVNAAGEEEK